MHPALQGYYMMTPYYPTVSVLTTKTTTAKQLIQNTRVRKTYFR